MRLSMSLSHIVVNIKSVTMDLISVDQFSESCRIINFKTTLVDPYSTAILDLGSSPFHSFWWRGGGGPATPTPTGPKRAHFPPLNRNVKNVSPKVEVE
jgi:hypothetical protein